MNILIFTVFLLSFILAQVLAACSCNSDDIDCLSNCVTNTQGCIRACGDDTRCYNSCIYNSWPATSRTRTTQATSNIPQSLTSTQSTTSSIYTSTVPTVSSTAASSALSSTPAAANTYAQSPSNGSSATSNASRRLGSYSYQIILGLVCFIKIMFDS